MPPAGLEPAALCLASSIRLSLTARQSWGCWLDYILDITVPTRIVSEDPQCLIISATGFLRITQSSRIFTCSGDQVPEALRASPHTGSSTQWVPTAFPIKAPTRQMLYPLSYRGTFKKSIGMLARQRAMSTECCLKWNSLCGPLRNLRDLCVTELLSTQRAQRAQR